MGAIVTVSRVLRKPWGVTVWAVANTPDPQQHSIMALTFQWGEGAEGPSTASVRSVVAGRGGKGEYGRRDFAVTSSQILSFIFMLLSPILENVTVVLCSFV